MGRWVGHGVRRLHGRPVERPDKALVSIVLSPTPSMILAVGRNDLVPAALARELDFAWAPARLLSVDLAKALGPSWREKPVRKAFDWTINGARSSRRLMSGYLVPWQTGTRLLTFLAGWGVAVQVVTNGYASTDVPVVHAGLVKRRRNLLRAGAKFYELGSAARAQSESRANFSGDAGSRFSGAGEGPHAKTFTVDARKPFLGFFDVTRVRRDRTPGWACSSTTRNSRALAEDMRERVPCDLQGRARRWRPVLDHARSGAAAVAPRRTWHVAR